MIIVLFLFQFSQIIKSSENNYTENDYEHIELVENKSWEKEHIELNDKAQVMNLEERFTLFVGDKKDNVGSIVSQWADYTKRQLCVASSITQYLNLTGKLPEFLIVDSRHVDFDTEIEKFEKLAGQGVSIVFCNLPDTDIIESNTSLKKLLGINFVKEKEVKVEGIKLFSGFLLGGESIYEPKRKREEKRQDMDLTMPWIITAGGTKTYMVGIMDDYYDDYQFKNEYFPAIIWRNSLGNAQVFCVCGDYMSQTTGLGILSAMIYELSDYQLYPIVNAQNTLLVNFPLMAYENETEFFDIYSRTVNTFQNDIIWPALIALSERFGLKYTSFLAPKYNYKDNAQADNSSYDKYLRLFNERKVEVGASMMHSKDTSLDEKIAYDEGFYHTLEKPLVSTSTFMDIEELNQVEKIKKLDYTNKIRTIACKENVQIPILSYLDDNTTLQSLTSDTEHLTYSQDLRLKSIETTLGYDNAELDFSDVFWPESEADQWQNSYNDMSSAMNTYWKPFRIFDRTTLTEGDERVRVFLNIDYKEARDQDEIKLTVTGRDNHTCFFILRTHGEKIEKMQGGNFQKIEKDAYLLKIEQDEVTIDLKNIETVK